MIFSSFISRFSPPSKSISMVERKLSQRPKSTHARRAVTRKIFLEESVEGSVPRRARHSSSGALRRSGEHLTPLSNCIPPTTCPSRNVRQVPPSAHLHSVQEHHSSRSLFCWTRGKMGFFFRRGFSSLKQALALPLSGGASFHYAIPFYILTPLFPSFIIASRPSSMIKPLN